MAESYGQEKTMGHSHGDLGHGGHHRVGGHGMNRSAEPHAQVHVKDPRGHTMAHEHGGSFGLGVGC